MRHALGGVALATAGLLSLPGLAAADTAGTADIATTGATTAIVLNGEVVSVAASGWLLDAHGAPHALQLPAPSVGAVVAAAAAPDGTGTWLLDDVGGVLTVGAAPYLGSLPELGRPEPVTAIEPTPARTGYWLATADGEVVAFGDAPHHGDAGVVARSAPVVDLVATSTGDGYWIITADGGVRAHGDAPFVGSAAPLAKAAPVVDAVATRDGQGLWLLGADGAVYAFGTATPRLPAALASGEAAVALVLTGDGPTPAVVTSRTPTATLLGRGLPPPVPAGSGAGRRVVYANGAQHVWLVGPNESVEHSYLVSGRRNTPAPGTYRVYSRSPRAWSAGGATMELMVRFLGGIGFHDLPRGRNGAPLQTDAQLGTPLSAGCVRQSRPDAEIMWDWAPLGTPVVVLR